MGISQLADLVKYISLLGVGARRDYDVTAGEAAAAQAAYVALTQGEKDALIAFLESL